MLLIGLNLLSACRFLYYLYTFPQPYTCEKLAFSRFDNLIYFSPLFYSPALH